MFSTECSNWLIQLVSDIQVEYHIIYGYSLKETKWFTLERHNRSVLSLGKLIGQWNIYFIQKNIK